MNKIILAVDIGGTNIKYALWNDGTLGEVLEYPTPKDSLDSLLKALKRISDKFPQAEGVAFSMPGFIDVEKGIAYTGGNLDYIKELDVVRTFSEFLGKPVSVENDAKAAVLAELQNGCLKDVNSAIMMVLGTGVGGAVVVDRKILRGANLLAGEFSYISSDITKPANFEYSLGTLGGAAGLSECVEECSGLKDLNGREIFHEIEEGNNEVLEGLNLFCERIVWLLYNLQVIVNPEIFAIGGGISQQPLLIKTIQDKIHQLSQKEMYKSLSEPQVCVCHYTAHANLAGAIFNYLEQT